MTTEDIIIHIFYQVDNALREVRTDKRAKLYPSAGVRIGLLFALNVGCFRAFYHWLARDYGRLFGGLPHRTSLLRQLKERQTLRIC
jgi:hypothetical protein